MVTHNVVSKLFQCFSNFMEGALFAGLLALSVALSGLSWDHSTEITAKFWSFSIRPGARLSLLVILSWYLGGFFLLSLDLLWKQQHESNDCNHRSITLNHQNNVF